MRQSREFWLARQAAAKIRKEKRKAKAKELWPIPQSMSLVKKRLWNLISLYVRLRDSVLFGGLCLICHIRPIQCAYHIVPSNDGAGTRWDWDNNIVGACHACNYGEMRHRFKYRLKHIQIFGAERMAALEIKASKTVKYSKADLLDLTAEIKLKIERRGNDRKSVN